MLIPHIQHKVTVSEAGANVIAMLPTVAYKKLKASKNEQSSVLRHVGNMTFRAAGLIFPQRNALNERQVKAKCDSVTEMYLFVELIWQVAGN